MESLSCAQRDKAALKIGELITTNLSMILVPLKK